MKLIMENWQTFVGEIREGTFSQKMLDTSDFEKISKSYGQPPAGQAEADIIRHGRLDITGKIGPAAMQARLKIVEDFLVAWVTGRMSHIGGPGPEEAKKKFGNYLSVDLYSKYKDMPTKFDQTATAQRSKPDSSLSADHPSDGLTPVDPQDLEIHAGGAGADTMSPVISPSASQDHPVSAEQALSALNKLTKVSLENLSPAEADNVKSILITILSALQK